MPETGNKIKNICNNLNSISFLGLVGPNFNENGIQRSRMNTNPEYFKMLQTPSFMKGDHFPWVLWLFLVLFSLFILFLYDTFEPGSLSSPAFAWYGVYIKLLLERSSNSTVLGREGDT